MDFHVVVLILFLIRISTVFSYILRSSCRYTADFSDIHDDTYFASANFTSLPNLNRRNCGFRCIADKSCLLYNHKKDNTTCELLYTFDGKLSRRTEWQHVSTDYSDTSYRGPMCKFVKPTVQPDSDNKLQICVDVCHAPGFEIVHWPNVVEKAEKSGKDLSVLTDGSIDGDYWETNKHTSQTFYLQLNRVSRVTSVYVVAAKLDKFKLDKLDLQVKVCGNRAQCEDSGYCVQNQVQADKRGVYTCQNGPLLGDRVFFTRHGQRKTLRLFEVEVYAV